MPLMVCVGEENCNFVVMKRVKERWAVWLPCKVYVKRWLIRRYNRPDENWRELVRLSGDRVLWRELLLRLRRGSRRGEARGAGRRWPTQVAVEITEDVFRRYGWELTGTELAEMNSVLEGMVKRELHAYVLGLSVTGMSLNECIRRYRRRTGIGEDDWGTDSIRKEVTRHVRLPDVNLYADFCRRVEENLWRNVSGGGTGVEC